MRGTVLVMVLLLAGCSAPPATDPVTVTQQNTVTERNTVTETSITTSETIVTETSSPTDDPTTTSPTSTEPTDNHAPEIVEEDFTASANGANGGRFSWTVDDTSPVASRVEYGTQASGAFSSSTPDFDGSDSFTTTVTGLASCTTYRARVTATDGVHNVLSGVASFTTAAAPVSVSVVGVTEVTDTGFKVNINVVGGTDAVSLVRYGPTSSYGSVSSGVTGSGAQSVTIAGVAADTTYNLKVETASPCGAGATGNFVQATARVIHLGIVNNPVLGRQFSPTSSSASPLAVPASTPLVFRIYNNDTVAHSWSIVGASPAYGSGSIAGGAVITMPVSISLPAGDHTMKTTYSGGTVTGTIRAS